MKVFGAEVTRGRRIGIGLLCLLVFVTSLSLSCTKWRYSRVFFTPEYMPSKGANPQQVKYDSFLPEVFEGWVVKVNAWAIRMAKAPREVRDESNEFYTTADPTETKWDEYDFGLSFWPEDDTSKIYDNSQVLEGGLIADSTVNTILVDTLHVELVPSGEITTLPTSYYGKGVNPIFSFSFRNVHIDSTATASTSASRLVLSIPRVWN